LSRIESLESRQLLAADTYVVTTLNDVAAVAGANEWSLREAIAAAAADGPGDNDVIEFGDLTGEIWLTANQLLINTDVEIRGPGAEALTINAHDASRVIYVAGAGTLNVKISGLTIEGGAASDGAGIYNDSENLTLDRVTVTDNHTTGGGTGLGGGLFCTTGSVTVIDSTFYNNTAKRGGAIRIQGFPAATLNITGSTLYNNESEFGEGAISVYSTTSSIKNTTISGNKAGYTGGAIMVEYSGQMTIVNSTIVENQAVSYGGGIYASGSATVTLHNTILAKNTSANTTYHDYIGTLAPASSYNIIGVDPLLAPLSDNGGPTKTHALLPGSPALNAGNNSQATAAGLTTDQRGRSRFVDFSGTSSGVADIGAYEAGLIVSTATDTADGNYTAGNLSLREALSLAFVLPGKQEIEFDSALWGQTIALGASGQLVVNSSVDILGPGADQLTIDAHLAS
jgi:fibronectin-binding autotransporter adhesin